jgi:hypothetical protein
MSPESKYTSKKNFSHLLRLHVKLDFCPNLLFAENSNKRTHYRKIFKYLWARFCSAPSEASFHCLWLQALSSVYCLLTYSHQQSPRLSRCCIWHSHWHTQSSLQSPCLHFCTSPSGISATFKSSQLCGPISSLSSVDIQITGKSGFPIRNRTGTSKVRSRFRISDSMSSSLRDRRTSCSDKYQHGAACWQAMRAQAFGTYLWCEMQIWKQKGHCRGLFSTR